MDDNDAIFKELDDFIEIEITDDERNKLQEKYSKLNTNDTFASDRVICNINFNDVINYQTIEANNAIKEYIRSGCEINEVLRGQCSKDISKIVKALLTELKPINKHNKKEYFEVYRAISNKYIDVSQGFISTSNILLKQFGIYYIKIYVPLNLPILVGNITNMLSNQSEYKNKTIYEILLPPMTPLKYIDSTHGIDNYIVIKV